MKSPLCLLFVFVVLALTGIASKSALADDLMAEVRKFQNQQPNSLYFQHLHPIGPGWILTCPGCDGVPAEDLFPRAVFECAERYSVGKKITLDRIQQLEIVGRC